MLRRAFLIHTPRSRSIEDHRKNSLIAYRQKKRNRPHIQHCVNINRSRHASQRIRDEEGKFDTGYTLSDLVLAIAYSIRPTTPDRYLHEEEEEEDEEEGEEDENEEKEEEGEEEEDISRER
jgi:hypothetical protein